jgi:hypothetical protein
MIYPGWGYSQSVGASGYPDLISRKAFSRDSLEPYYQHVNEPL